MGILRTLKKTGDAVVRAVSVFSVAFCLLLNVGVCLCDPDPDDCGEHCHDCGGASQDECSHISIDMDGFLVPQSDDTVPQAHSSRAFVYSPVIRRVVARTRPVSTAPPDSGGAYVSYSAKLHPLS